MSITIHTISSAEPVAEHLSSVISAKLSTGTRVLWLVSGGSAIDVAVKTAKLLEGLPLKHLTITLTDERYGKVGHVDSNWAQLKQAGFSTADAQLIPVITGESLEDTGKAYAANLESLLEHTDYRIGLFGIGPDGHTAGLLTGSAAINSNELAVSYKDTQKDNPASAVKRGISRITMTPSAIGKLDEAVVYAIGEAKWPQLARLADTIDIALQPAQVLKQVPKLVIFTDMEQEGV